MLQAGRAYMFAQGYRPATAEGHKSTFALLEMALGLQQRDLIAYFDRMRNKRNEALYGMAGRVAETEAQNLLRKAEEFVRFIRMTLQKGEG